MRLSYQHCPPHMFHEPYPGVPIVELVRFVKVGVPVATSSLRNSLAVGLPLTPSATYIRVLPFFVVTAICALSLTLAFAVAVWLIGTSICVHVAPSSFERQTPLA